MRPSVFFLSLSFGLFTCASAFAQEPVVEPPIVPVEAVEPIQPEPTVFTVVEQMPEYKGGQQALMSFLTQNLRYPEDAREAEVQGKVYIRFVITPEGHLTNVEVLRGVNGMPSLAKEAVRVVKLTDGNWTPGKQNGKPVPVQFILPVNFVLQ